MTKPRILASVALFVAAVHPSLAHAGGFYLTDRGARPMTRGFAFVAGADDPNALWYNPAGLAWSGQQLLLDGTFTMVDGSYTRVDSGGNTLQPVDIGQVPLPIPAIAYSHPLPHDFTIGIGIFAPNAVLLDYPHGLTASGAACDPTTDAGCGPAPQRYSLLTMKGTALAHLSLAAAWQPVRGLSIGLGMQMMTGTFQAETTLSACDGAICTQPENPDWDGVVHLDLFPIVELAPQAGITYDAGPIRFGASFLWWPNAIRGTADMRVRLPAAPLFEGARVEGHKADVTIDFPFQLRMGVEIRPGDRFRLEGAVVWERWSTQQAITIKPQNVWIRDLVAIGDYQVGDVTIPRNMNDVWSFRLGGSYALLRDRNLVLSAGAMYENGAFDDAHLTALTLDTRKLALDFGVSFRLGEHVWVDASYGHVFLEDRNVTNSRVPQANPIRPPLGGGSQGSSTFVGNGHYAMEANMFGLGLRWQIDPRREPSARLPSAPVASATAP